MTVLRGAARRFALVLALSTAAAFIPVRPVAADPVGATVRADDLWQAALHWLAALWNPAPPDSAPPAGADAAGVCGGDQGMCIDPNG